MQEPEVISEIEGLSEHNFTRLQQLDRQVNGLYHKLEYDKLDAVGMVRLASSLKGVLIHRRQCKENGRYYQSFIDSIKKVRISRQKSLKKIA